MYIGEISSKIDRTDNILASLLQSFKLPITMLFLKKPIAGLTLFSPAAYALATPEQVAMGIVKGFTGPADATESYVSLIL